MAFDDWMKEKGNLPPRRDGFFDRPVPGKPVPKSTDKPAAAPSPPFAPASAPAPAAPASKGSTGHGQSTTHREGSFPDFHGSLDYE